MTDLPNLPPVTSQRASNVIGAAGAKPTAESDAEGGARSFRSPKDITASGYLVCVADGVGEASITYHGRSSGQSVRDPEVAWLVQMAPFINDDGELETESFILSEFDRQVANEKRAHSRAVKSVRQFCVRWRLTKMWTFTFAIAQWDKKEVKAQMNAFLIRWRVLNGGKEFPYLYVLELHPGGHGYHLHVAVPGDLFTDWHQLKRVWGNGVIQYSENTRHSGESRNDSRRLAVYLSKYLGKDLSDDHFRGEHRFETAQGFRIQTTRRWFATFQHAAAFLELGVKGERFYLAWSDYEVDSWMGPPTWLYRSG